MPDIRQSIVLANSKQGQDQEIHADNECRRYSTLFLHIKKKNENISLKRLWKALEFLSEVTLGT